MNPKTTVGAIIHREEKILLALRNHDPFDHYWCLPGGHIDFGEDPETAVKREVLEETGLETIQLRFFDYFNEYYPELGWHAVALVFVINAEGSLKRQESEVRELKWYRLQDALHLRLAFNHKTVLEKFFNSELSREYIEKDYIS